MAIYTGTKNNDEGIVASASLDSTTGDWGANSTYDSVVSVYNTGDDGSGMVLDITTDGSKTVSISILEGGFGYSVDDEVRFNNPLDSNIYIIVNVDSVGFADTGDPPEARSVTYIDRATGDIMCKVTFDGVTKLLTLVDFDEGSVATPSSGAKDSQESS